MYVGTKRAREYYGCTTQTLRRWADQEIIRYKRSPKGTRYYWIADKEVKATEQPGDNEDTSPPRERIAYCRVSSRKQIHDLERQVQFLANQFPEHRIVKDVGSGLNFKRPGLLSILGLVMSGRVQQIVVASKDRLCRFAFELFDHISKKFDTEILVLDRSSDKSPDEEFTEDVLAVMQVFSCRWNGKRSYSTKKATSSSTSTNQSGCEGNRGTPQ